VPEYVVGRWWENLLHNQSALRIKGRLLFEPGVMVTSVPWQLRSSQDRDLDRFDQALTRVPARGPRSRVGEALPGGRPGPAEPAPEKAPDGSAPPTAADQPVPGTRDGAAR
jgi:hypothetical protein